MTLEALTHDLSARQERSVNICLTHHHPQRHEDIDLDDYEVMEGGQALLSALGSGLYGRWIVIHGHKHFPKVGYAQGSTSAPIVFSAGSLTANLYKDLQTRARNQFYLIEIRVEDIDKFGLVGEIHAWDWSVGTGWAPSAGPSSGLRSRSGFGYREDAKLIAKRIHGSLGDGIQNWSDVTERHKELKYLIAGDYEILKLELKKLGFRIVEQSGVPVQLGQAK